MKQLFKKILAFFIELFNYPDFCDSEVRMNRPYDYFDGFLSLHARISVRGAYFQKVEYLPKYIRNNPRQMKLRQKIRDLVMDG